MKSLVVSATEFKAKCLALLDEVDQRGAAITVTKRPCLLHDTHVVVRWLVDVDIAAEVAALSSALRDPADSAIVATARIHRLRLVTSDQRMIESKLVSVVA
jgi:hypothetical protein